MILLFEDCPGLRSAIDGGYPNVRLRSDAEGISVSGNVVNLILADGFYIPLRYSWNIIDIISFLKEYYPEVFL